MKSLTLMEEISPAHVISAAAADRELWSSPPPVAARYRIVERVERRDLPHGLRAEFWSVETLEEFDWFATPEGWRVFGSDAPDRLRHAGFAVRVVTIPDQRAAARAYIIAQGVRRAGAEIARAAGAAMGAEYKTWRENITRGLTKTTDFSRFSVDWEPVRFWPPEVAGTWYSTGDSWSRAKLPDGRDVYCCDYGAACVYFVPPDVADRRAQARWEELRGRKGSCAAAQEVLLRHDRGCYGDDVHARIFNLVGEQKLVELAHHFPYVLYSYSSIEVQNARVFAERYGIELVIMEPLPGKPYDEMPVSELGQKAESLWRYPLDGRTIAVGYDGSRWSVK